MGNLIFVLLAFLQFNDYNTSSYADLLCQVIEESNYIVLPQYRHVKGSKVDANFIIIDKDGMLQIEGTLQGNTLNIGDLEKGIYYIKTISCNNEPMSYYLTK